MDDYEGRYSLNWAVEQYYNNQFNGGGNRPSCGQRGNWLFPDGNGRTFYVGKRKNGKLIRIYEKGKQLGDPNSPWVRWEVEQHNRQREIPWDGREREFGDGRTSVGSNIGVLGAATASRLRRATGQRFDGRVSPAAPWEGTMFLISSDLRGIVPQIHTNFTTVETTY